MLLNAEQSVAGYEKMLNVALAAAVPGCCGTVLQCSWGAFVLAGSCRMSGAATAVLLCWWLRQSTPLHTAVLYDVQTE
jgi:hypothetical protein